MTMAQRRVDRASNLIAASDDPEIIDREMRYIRPFWEFYTARRKFNNTRFWENRSRDVFRGYDEETFRKTPLVWLPTREAMCTAAESGDEPSRMMIVNVLRGMDVVLFNFLTLLSRMKNLLGIDDPQSFQITAIEKQSDGYQLMRRTVQRESAGGESIRIVTCRFRLPGGEELKIEKDLPDGLGDPLVTIRMHNTERADSRDRRLLQYLGTQRQLSSRLGGQLRVR